MPPAVATARHRSPALLVGGGVSAFVVAAAIVHIGLGASNVGIGDIAEMLGGGTDPNTANVFFGSRLPRTLAGLAVGIALGVSGALIQGVTRNPLAAPDTLGVNAGAYAAVTLLAVSGVQVGVLGSGGAAFVGALAAVLLVYFLTSRGVLSPGRVLLAGASVALTGMAIAEFMQILDEQATTGLFFWGNGSLLQSGLERPVMLGAAIGITVLFAPLLARPLDLISLGDQTAEAMGVRVERVRPAALLLAVLLAAMAVTLAGPVGFVGLIAPVAVRLLGIRRHAAVIPLSGLLGAALLLGADSVAQIVFPPSAGYSELPVGIVTALIGGPIFVLLARRVTTGDADTGAAVSSAGTAPARSAIAFGIGSLALLAMMVIGLGNGDVDVSWAQVLGVLTGSGDDTTSAIVWFRLPRIVVAVLAGACLAVAGAAVQAVVRNPLAEPNLLGITGGASAFAVVVTILMPTAPAAALPVAAALGGVLTLGLVMLVARKNGTLAPTRVVLVGLGMAATTAAIVNIVAVGAQMNLASALTWLAGSTYARDFGAASWMAVPAVAAVALTVAARPVNMLSLGDDLPRSLGLSLGRTRLLVLGAGAVLAAGTAAAVGAIGFVGLVAPHLARRIVGNDARKLIPMAALLGSVLVVTADAIGRSLLAPTEIPVGIVTAVIGAPYLVWLLRRMPTT